MNSRSLLFGLVSLLISLMLLVLFFYSPERGGMPVHHLERRLLDQLFVRARPSFKPNPSVIVVAVNDGALRAMEPLLGRWPWPRRVMGEMIEYLTPLGVRAIGIDVLYPERNLNDPEGDRFFAEQARIFNRLALAVDFPDRKQGTTLKEVEIPSRFRIASPPPSLVDIPASGSALLPFESLREGTAAIGGIHLTADPDGPTRRYRLVYRYGDEGKSDYYPSLALAMAELTGLPPEWIKIPLYEDGSIPVFWYGPVGTFTYVSADKILKAREEWKGGGGGLHRQAAAFFKDKIVLIGVTGTGLFDLRNTPFSSVYPGAEVHATVLSNLLQSHFLYPADRWAVCLYVVLLSLMAGLGAARLQSPLKETAIFLGLAVIVVVLGVLVFRFNAVWLPTALPLISLALIGATTLSWNYFTTGREKRFIRRAFARYINEEVLKQLVLDPRKLNLGGENIPVTVLFSDIRNFTSLSEKMSPDQVVALLNEYLTEMVEVLFEYGGTLDKFIGDAVMAFWGAPLRSEDHAEKCVAAALEMLARVRKIRARWEAEGKPPIKIGIGINTAVVTVGNVGSEKSQNYTAIGDGVNLASRLESLNKNYGTELIVSEFTCQKIKDRYQTRFLDEVQVKGKEEKVRIYEVIQPI